MRKLFDLESPFIQGLNKMADLMILNLLCIIFCIPIITAGATFTALHFVVLKMVRNEETYIIKTFFRSFKENFVQSTLLWIIKVFVFVFIIVDIRIADAIPWMKMGLIAVGVLLYLLGLHIFPLQSRFVNKIPATIKNSVLLGLMVLPKTILMGLILILPLAFWYVSFVIMGSGMMTPILVLFGFSFPAFLCALLYNKTFKKIEPSEENNGDEWTVDMTEAEGVLVEEKETDNIGTIESDE